MRYLIDTNIFIFIATDPMSLTRDIYALISDPDVELCMSSVSVKELLVAYRHKGFNIRRWKTPEDMVNSIVDDYCITVLPVGMSDMKVYSRLKINEREGHNDPNDHVIISQALNMCLPLISSDHKFKFYKKQGLDLIYNE